MPLSIRRLWSRQPSGLVLTLPDAYALWARNYPPIAHNPLMEAEQRALAPMLARLSPTRALDLGTGTGRNLPLLSAAGAQLAVALDLSLPMLTAHAAPAMRVCAHALQLPFRDRQFDLVASSLMVGDVPDLWTLSREVARVLSRGGHFVYSDFHPLWSARRWRRTFRSVDGRDVELPYCPHALEDHQRALGDAGFEIRAIREPRVAGQCEPAVIVFHAIRDAGSSRGA